MNEKMAGGLEGLRHAEKSSAIVADVPQNVQAEYQIVDIVSIQGENVASAKMERSASGAASPMFASRGLLGVDVESLDRRLWILAREPFGEIAIFAADFEDSRWLGEWNAAQQARQAAHLQSLANVRLADEAAQEKFEAGFAQQCGVEMARRTGHRITDAWEQRWI